MKAKKASQNVTRKAIDTYKDPYLPKEGLHDMALCRECHAIYHNKRWFLDEALYQERVRGKGSLLVLCPACQKIRDRFIEGFVTLKGDFLKGHKEEILNLIRNKEERARSYNPLDRIIEIKDKGDVVEITTTTEKFAQRIGQILHRAYHGEVEYKWSEDDKVARVAWSR